CRGGEPGGPVGQRPADRLHARARERRLCRVNRHAADDRDLLPDPAVDPGGARGADAGGRRGGRAGAVTRRARLPTTAVVLLGTAAVALAFALSLAIGSRSISPVAAVEGLVAVLSGDQGGGLEEAIVASRLDRSLIGLVVGTAVALSGATMQGLTRNPLADPGILGVNSGAALAVVLGLQFAGISTVGGYLWLALLGG